jgi:hypothetical protein
MDRRRGVAAALALMALSGAAGGLAGCSSAGSSGSASSAGVSANHDARLAGESLHAAGKAAGSGQPVADVAIEPARLPRT